MNTPFPHHRPQDSGSYGLDRDARIGSLLGTHPVTAAMLVRLGWFPNTKKALQRLRILAKRKAVTRVGAVWRKEGRPENVYCLWHPKSDHLLHEVELSEVCLQLSAGVIRRDPAIMDRAIRADAEVVINQELFYLELDRGTMRMGQIERRLARYEGSRHISLWICADGKRLEEVRRRAAKVRHTALFTTFAEAKADPHAEIWQDFGGARVALPRERRAVAAADQSPSRPPTSPLPVPDWLSPPGHA